MNEKDILGRIKNADPAANLEIDETLIEGSIASGNRKAKAARRRNSFFAAAGSGALALSVFASMSFGPSTQQSLITLGEGSQQGGQQGRLASSESAPGAGSTSMCSDKMMWINPYIYKYVAGSELSAEGSSARVYKVDLLGDPDVLLANLMKVFGVSGVTNQTIELGGHFSAHIAAGEAGDPGPAAVAGLGQRGGVGGRIAGVHAASRAARAA